MLGESSVRKEKASLGKVTTLSSSTPASCSGQRQNHLPFFWEHCDVSYSIKSKLLLLSEPKDKIYILLYLHSASWNLSAVHIQSQKMGKWLYTMSRRTHISLTQPSFSWPLHSNGILGENQLWKAEKVSTQLLNEVMIDEKTEIIWALHNISSWFLLQYTMSLYLQATFSFYQTLGCRFKMCWPSTCDKSLPELTFGVLCLEGIPSRIAMASLSCFSIV